MLAYDQLGDLLFILGRTAESFRAYETVRDRAEAMAKADPNSIPFARDVALAHDKLGDMNRFNNDIPAAEASFRRAIAVREALIARHGQYPDVLRDLCVSSNKIGLIHLRKGEYPKALAEFTRALEFLNQYAPTYSPQIKVVMDYEYTYRQLAQACFLSDWKTGAAYSRKALESAQAFVAAEPENLIYRTKLAIDYDQLGASLGMLGDLAGTEANWLEALEVRRAILAAEPGSAESQRNVAVSYRYLGDLARCRRNTEEARSLYQKCLALCETLAAADPGSAQKQGDILESLGVLADNAERVERFGEALEWVQRTLQKLDGLEREKRLSPAVLNRSRLIATGQQALYQAATRGLGLDSRATTAPSPGLDLPPVLQDWWKLLRGMGLARRGRHVEAAAEIRDVLSHDPEDALESLRVGRIFARCAEAVAAGKPDIVLTSDERSLQQAYIQSALDAVRRTIRLAPDMAVDTFAEPDFHFLRLSGDLEAVARELGQEGSRKATAPVSGPSPRAHAPFAPGSAGPSASSLSSTSIQSSATVVAKPGKTRLAMTWSSRNTASCQTSPCRVNTVTLRSRGSTIQYSSRPKARYSWRLVW